MVQARCIESNSLAYTLCYCNNLQQVCFEILRAGITHSTTDTQALLQRQKHFVSDQEGGH